MRRILIILEAATIGMVTAFGFLSLWHDWKSSTGPKLWFCKFTFLQ